MRLNLKLEQYFLGLNPARVTLRILGTRVGNHIRQNCAATHKSRVELSRSWVVRAGVPEIEVLYNREGPM